MKIFDRNREIKNKDIEENDNPDKKITNQILATPSKEAKEPLDTSSHTKNGLFDKTREEPTSYNEATKLKKSESEITDKSLVEHPDEASKKKNDFIDSLKVSTPLNNKPERLKKSETDNNTDGDPNIGSLEREKVHTSDIDMDER